MMKEPKPRLQPSPDRPGGRGKHSDKADDKAARKARLAQALRDNLHRRRAQARARKTASGDD